MVLRNLKRGGEGARDVRSFSVAPDRQPKQERFKLPEESFNILLDIIKKHPDIMERINNGFCLIYIFPEHTSQIMSELEMSAMDLIDITRNSTQIGFNTDPEKQEEFEAKKSLGKKYMEREFWYLYATDAAKARLIYPERYSEIFNQDAIARCIARLDSTSFQNTEFLTLAFAIKVLTAEEVMVDATGLLHLVDHPVQDSLQAEIPQQPETLNIN